MTDKEFVLGMYPNAYVNCSDTKTTKFFYVVFPKKYGYPGPNGASAQNENDMWYNARKEIERQILWQLEN